MAFKHVVMNCLEWNPKKWHSNGCVGFKEDGVRGFYYPGESQLWSRDEKCITGMGHIVDELKKQKYPVDLELVIPGMEFNKMSGLIRNHHDTLEARAKVIDIPLPGINLVDRFALRPRAGEFVTNIVHFRTEKLSRVECYYEKWEKYEGLVWKDLNQHYINARRWMRWVPVKSEDCECIGVYEGKGKMEGMAGGIFIRFNGIECKCGTMRGMTYENRRELFNNQDQYIGLVAEIQYKNLQPSGKPRQPRFKGWRYDKS